MADWRRVESDNFILFAEAKEDVALELLGKLERYRRFLIEHGGVRPNLGGLKLTIYFTQSRRRYDALTGLKSSNGVFKLIQNGPIAVFFQPKKPHERVQARLGPYQDEEHQVVFHEYVHFLQFQAVPTQYPLWYREGFAEYLSSAVFRQDDTIVGKVLYGRARNLHQFKWYDIKDILDADSFGDKAYMFYAQAWLLNHMLYTLPEFRDGISEFLDLLENNIDPAEALSKAYGIDYETLDARLREYFDSGQLYVIPYPAVSANLNILSNQQLDKAESALVDKSIRLAFSRTSRQFKSIAKSVNILLKKRPRNTELAVTLIEALMGEGKWGAAQKVATELADASPNLQVARALLGEIVLRRALARQEADKSEHPNAGKLIEARNHLAGAITSMPLNARARKWYAGSYIYGNQSDFDSAGPAITEAYRLYPQDWDIRRQYADLLFSRGDYSNACKLYKPLYHTSTNDDEKERLEKRVEDMENCGL